MLDPWIIEEIRRREEERREQSRRAIIEMPLPSPDMEERPERPDAGSDIPRGVTVIDFSV